MARRYVVVLGLVAGALHLGGQPASACSCMGYAAFDEVARRAPLVVIGQVVDVGPRWPGLRPDGLPMAVHLDVSWTPKGSGPSRLRVWDGAANSSCGGALWRLSVGQWVVVALDAVAAKPPELRESWKDWPVQPADGDFLLAAPVCAESLRRLDGAAQALAWALRPFK
ncbi:MAG: hypothetical protein R2745_22405 [Vicinamibacterales bacterium]